jgi:hypothetical protein
MTAEYRIGDVFARLAEIPDGSVDLILTSPPFLALRSYLPADHPDKGKEIGSEPTPAAFLDTLLALSAEWRRVLALHGSICVELGDTYSGSGGRSSVTSPRPARPKSSRGAPADTSAATSSGLTHHPRRRARQPRPLPAPSGRAAGAPNTRAAPATGANGAGPRPERRPRMNTPYDQEAA